MGIKDDIVAKEKAHDANNEELHNLNDLYSFGNITVNSFEKDENTGGIILVGELNELRCPYCGSTNVSKRSQYKRECVDSPIAGKPTTLRIVTSRIDCHNMRVSHDAEGSYVNRFSEKGRTALIPKIDGIPPYVRTTPRLREQIANENFVQNTFKELGLRYGLSDKTVAEIFDEKIDAIEPTIHYPECSMIGLDEVHLGEHDKSRNPVMYATIVDLSTPKTRLLDILQRNNKDAIVKALGRFPSPEKIKWVCMDMHKPYVAAIEDCLPHAGIIVDRFHVEATLNKVLADSLRRVHAFYEEQISGLSDPVEREREMEKFKKRPYNIAWFRKKMSTYIKATELLDGSPRNKKKLTATQIEEAKKDRNQFMKLTTLCNAYPEYNQVVTVHEAFIAMYEQTTRENASKAFDSAVALLPNKRLKNHILAPFHSYVKTVENWKEKILNYFDAAYEPHRSNGPVEQWNRTINRAFNDGNGYEFKHLRAKMLFGAGKIKLSDDFKFVAASSNYFDAVTSLNNGETDNPKQFRRYCQEVVKSIAKHSESEDNSFMKDVVQNIDTVDFSMLFEVLLANPYISFNVAAELDARLYAKGSCEIIGITIEEFKATYQFIRTQIEAGFESSETLVPKNKYVYDTDDLNELKSDEDT